MREIVKRVATTVTAVCLFSALPTAAHATAAGLAGSTVNHPLYGDHLNKGETLDKGQSITGDTVNGPVQLIMQDDGNLVLYAPNGTACWATGTNNSGGDHPGRRKLRGLPGRRQPPGRVGQ
ncbi:hypothetical protein AB5J72_47585 [Streptomyces sp. CG1]|uniref:hypothetical protein n=1 Tax=Streptomyces sp. CG1 TaxID=1287523 RepID=UPI0034E2DA49